MEERLINGILAVIPARGGSKGVSRKNIRVVAGKPLIAWTIESAKDAALVDRVVVSTDDPEIAAVSKEYGAEVVWRPEAISGDLASSEDALLHALGYLSRHGDYEPDLLAFLQCTAPLMKPHDIDGTIRSLLDNNADSAFSGTDFHYFLWRRQDDGEMVGINHDKSQRLLRQERAPQFQESGAVYVMKREGFLKHRHRFFGKTAMYEMPGDRCWEVDDYADLHIVESILCERQETARRNRLPANVAALVLDFDGVFTDNNVHVSQDGSESVVCSRADGMGIERLRGSGVRACVISSERNAVVQARCDKLEVECFHDVGDKVEVFESWLQTHAIRKEDVVYVGNDLNDLACVKLAGCGVVVNDAVPEVKQCADIVLSRRGGEGAVRELCELIIESRLGDCE